MTSLSNRWKVTYVAFLAAMTIVAAIIKDYPAIGLLLSVLAVNCAFLINPKESKAKKLTQIAFLCVAIVGACVYLYLRIKPAA